MSEHVYCVAVTFEMTEQVEQQICIQFCVKLEHSYMETIWVIQKAAAVGNWRLAASSDNAPAHASPLLQRFWQKYQITQVTQPLLQPRFGIL